MRKLYLGLSTLAVLVTGLFMITNQHAHALSYTNYCDVMARPIFDKTSSGTSSSKTTGAAAYCEYGAYESNDPDHGNGALGAVAYSGWKAGTNDGTIITSSATLKSNFESYIGGSFKYGFQNAGAAYIKKGLAGGGSNWKTLLDQPSVTLKVANYNNDNTTDDCLNTAYYDGLSGGSAGVVTLTECVNKLTLEFVQNGKIVYAIKIDCGNPIGKMPGLQTTPVAHTPTGSISASCSVSGSVTTYTISYSYGDADGTSGDPAAAFLKNTGSSSASGISGSGSTAVSPYKSGSNTLHYTSWPGASGAGTVYLFVHNAGTGGPAVVPTSPGPGSVGKPSSCTGAGSGWTLDGIVSASVGSLNPGNPVIFTYGVKNFGPGQATGITYGGSWFNSATDVSGTVPADSTNYPGSAYDTPPYLSVATLNAGATASYSGVAHTAPSSGFVCAYTRYTPQDSSGAGHPRTAILCVPITQPPAVPTSCTVNVPSTASVGQAFNFTVIVYYSSGVMPASPSNYFNVDGSGTQTGGTASGSVVTFTGTASIASTGVHTANGGDSGHIVSCSHPITVGYLPYFSILGGDIAAGPGFCGKSSTNTSAVIKGENTDNTPAGTYAGAGSQLAGLALGQISSFTPNQADNSGVLGTLGVVGPNKLAFANTSASGSTYGGAYGDNSWCMPDYVGTIDPGAPGPGAYSTSGTFTLPGGSTIGNVSIPNGKNIVVKVNGDVYIHGTGINYASYSGSINNIPRFTLLVLGNIYIDPTVTTLSGFYVAEGGTIYTCGSSSFAPINAYGACKTKLTVNGALSAKKVVFGRTLGNIQPVAGATFEPAETVQFSPELWLSGIDETTTGGINTAPWQSITSLPPVL